MDFRTAPAVIAALEARVAHGVFGYPAPENAYYEAVTRWFARRHGLRLSRDGIIPTSGVVPALRAILCALCEPGDGVIVQPPVYDRFFSSIQYANCIRIENPLVLREGRYEMDFADLERKAAIPGARVLLLCNPHNPVGRVWTRSELQRLFEICAGHGITVVSDEIHGDLAFSGHPFTPITALHEDAARACVTCTGPGKAFNISGLHNACVLVGGRQLRSRIKEAVTVRHLDNLNPMGLVATTAAYDQGEPWLNALVAYLEGNYRMVRQSFADHFPHIDVIHLDGTYLAWIDCRGFGLTSETLAERLVSISGVRVTPGSIYGDGAAGFLRVNFACPRAMLEDGLHRLIRGLEMVASV